MMSKKTISIGVLCLAVISGLACNKGDPALDVGEESHIKTGSANGPCFDNETCFKGLTCRNGICVAVVDSGIEDAQLNDGTSDLVGDAAFDAQVFEDATSQDTKIDDGSLDQNVPDSTLKDIASDVPSDHGIDVVVDVSIDVACVDELGCTKTGLRRCVNSGYQQCGNYDTDACREWSITISCNPDEICQFSDGTCIQSCKPNCTGKPCGGSDGCGGTCSTGICGLNEVCSFNVCVCAYVSCGAGCCKAGETCKQGQCVPPSQVSWKAWSPVVTTQDLQGIWGSAPNDVWVVGEASTALHFNGVAWSTKDIGTSANLHGVWGFSSNDVWAVGQTATSPFEGVVLHYDGNQWSTVMGLPKVIGLQRIRGISSNDLWAVGHKIVSSQPVAVIVHYDGKNWTEANPGSTYVSSIWPLSTHEVWAVAPSLDKAVLYYDGVQWAQVSTGDSNNFWYDVFGFSSSNIWAVGMGAYGKPLFHFDGKAWQQKSVPVTVSLYALWGDAPQNVWAVGVKGTILSFNGSGWDLHQSGVTNELRGIWGSSPYDVWAVGGQGTLLHYGP